MAINPKLSDLNLDPDALRRYEIDLKNGVFKANGPEDQKMMDAMLDRIGPINEIVLAMQTATPTTAPTQVPVVRNELTLSGVLEKFIQLKAKTSEATVTDYTATVAEFSLRAKNIYLSKIDDAEITDYMEWLSLKKNGVATIDKKIGAIRALFNFAKKQKYYLGDNPAAGRNLRTRKQKNAGGSKFYQLDDVKRVYDCEGFRAFAKTAPNFYFVTVAGLVTGVRVSAIAALAPGDFKISTQGVRYVKVRKDKTDAGIRDLPIPRSLFEPMQAYLVEHGDFGFPARADGKGSSDPVRKFFDKHLKAVGMQGENFTFHGLRKTLNNFLLREKVSLEARCQYLGHDIDHVNVGVYTEKFSLEELAELITPAQEKLLRLIDFR